MVAITILIFIIFPVFSLALILMGLFFDKKYQKIYAFLFSIWMGILVYYLKPDKSLDLYRYYEIMKTYKIYSFSIFLKKYLLGTEPLSKLFLYIISKTGNFNLLPFITSIISYNILFYIFFDYIKDKKITFLERTLLLLFILSSFIVVYIIGIRYVLSRLVFFLALYLDLYKNKNKKAILLYLISLLLHSGIIICILCRIFLLLTKGKLKIKELIIIIILGLSRNLIFKFINLLSNISILSTLSKQLSNYSVTTYSEFQNMYFLQFFTLTLIGLFLIYLKFFQKNKSIVNNSFLNFNIIIFCLDVLYCKIPTFLLRLLLILITNSLILCIDYFNKRNDNSKKIIYVSLITLIVPYFAYQLISLSTAGSYGNLFSIGLIKNIIILLFY